MQGECNCEYPSDKEKQKNVYYSLVSIILSSILTLFSLDFLRLSCNFLHSMVLFQSRPWNTFCGNKDWPEVSEWAEQKHLNEGDSL